MSDVARPFLAEHGVRPRALLTVMAVAEEKTCLHVKECGLSVRDVALPAASPAPSSATLCLRLERGDRRSSSQSEWAMLVVAWMMG